MTKTKALDLDSLNQQTGLARERFLEKRDLDSWFEYFERLIQMRQARKRLQGVELD